MYLLIFALALSVILARFQLWKYRFPSPYQTILTELAKPESGTKTLRNKVALITGGTSGIGFEVAFALSLAGCNVVITGTNRLDLERAQRRLHELGSPYGSISCIEMDPLDLTSIRAGARHFLAMNLPLHYLILNSTVKHLPPGVERSVQGLEPIYAWNHLSHNYLAKLLMPKLQATAFEWEREVPDMPRMAASRATCGLSGAVASRIIVLTSDAYEEAYPTGRDNSKTSISIPDWFPQHTPAPAEEAATESTSDLAKLAELRSTKYKCPDAPWLKTPQEVRYARSMLCNLALAVELDAVYGSGASESVQSKGRIIVTAVYPGAYLATSDRSLTHPKSLGVRLTSFLIAPFVLNTQKASTTAVYCTVGPFVKSGQYYNSMQRAEIYCPPSINFDQLRKAIIKHADHLLDPYPKTITLVTRVPETKSRPNPQPLSASAPKGPQRTQHMAPSSQKSTQEAQEVKSRTDNVVSSSVTTADHSDPHSDEDGDKATESAPLLHESN